MKECYQNRHDYRPRWNPFGSLCRLTLVQLIASGTDTTAEFSMPARFLCVWGQDPGSRPSTFPQPYWNVSVSNEIFPLCLCVCVCSTFLFVCVCVVHCLFVLTHIFLPENILSSRKDLPFHLVEADVLISTWLHNWNYLPPSIWAPGRTKWLFKSNSKKPKVIYGKLGFCRLRSMAGPLPRCLVLLR